MKIDAAAKIRDRLTRFLVARKTGGLAALERQSGLARPTLQRFRDGGDVKAATLRALDSALLALESEMKDGSNNLAYKSSNEQRWSLLAEELSLLVRAVGPDSPLAAYERIGRVDKFVDAWAAHRDAFESQLAESKNSA